MFTMTSNMKLTLLPSGKIMETSRARRLADLIRELSMPLGFSCGGRGVCVACVVHTRGEFSAINDREVRLLDLVETAPEGWSARIACLARLQGDGEVRATYW